MWHGRNLLISKCYSFRSILFSAFPPISLFFSISLFTWIWPLDQLQAFCNMACSAQDWTPQRSKAISSELQLPRPKIPPSPFALSFYFFLDPPWSGSSPQKSLCLHGVTMKSLKAAKRCQKTCMFCRARSACMCGCVNTWSHDPLAAISPL